MLVGDHLPPSVMRAATDPCQSERIYEQKAAQQGKANSGSAVTSIGGFALRERCNLES
jgi:hypothetical protein